jgi:AcrR family transcriptional regulator
MTAEPADGSARNGQKRAAPRISARAAARREEILTALMEKIARKELLNPSLREIGRALEMEAAHLLYYFASREELLECVIMRWDEQSHASVGRDGSTLDSFADQVVRNMAIPGIMHLYLSFAAEAVDPAHPAHDFFLKRFAEVGAMLERNIRREQEAGIIAPEVDPARQARQLIALSDGLQLQSLVNAQVDAAGDLRDAIRALRRFGDRGAGQ